ncbi:hypothetical protein ACJX0J_005522, partial [Zea mays]
SQIVQTHLWIDGMHLRMQLWQSYVHANFIVFVGALQLLELYLSSFHIICCDALGNFSCTIFFWVRHYYFLLLFWHYRVPGPAHLRLYGQLYLLTKIRPVVACFVWSDMWGQKNLI